MSGAAVLRAARALAPRSGLYSRAPHVAQRALHSSTKRPHEVLGTAAKLPEAEPIPAQKSRERVTIDDILVRRAKAGKLVAGTAAYSDSDMFKAPVSFYVCIDTRKA